MDNAESGSWTTTWSTQPGGAAAGTQAATYSQVKENDGDSTNGQEAQDQHSKTIHPRDTAGWLFTKTSSNGWMRRRSQSDSFKEELNQTVQLLSEVRDKKLLKRGESVCMVVVENVRQGTGVVLFDNFILTNAHLFKDCVEGHQLKEGINVFALFNYEDPDLYAKYYFFQLALQFIYYDELDYAILELKTQNKLVVPPGLLNKFGPMPPNGEICIIGHPAGGVKKIGFTCVIEKEKREQAVNDHIRPYENKILTLCSICHLISKQGIENIMVGGNRADTVITYKTFMYDGSSGSPVFDAYGQVFGLHTRGYVYGFPNEITSVIEYAQPLLTIFEHFVSKLKENGKEELFNKVEKAAKRNRDLQKILVSVCGPKETRKRKASSSGASGPKAKRPRTELPQP